jgi:hypothetical protein
VFWLNPAITFLILFRDPRGAQPATASAGAKREPSRLTVSPRLPTADPSWRPTRGAVDGAGLLLLQRVALAHRGGTVPGATGKRTLIFAGGC